jgi:hypothetical protein
MDVERVPIVDLPRRRVGVAWPGLLPIGRDHSVWESLPGRRPGRA